MPFGRIMGAALAVALSVGSAGAETVTIRNDGGGNITEYIARRSALARAEKVEIRGACLSACVIFTTLSNACVAPRARIGFHGTRPKSGIYEIDLWLDGRVAQFLRGEVKRRYLAEWRHISGQRSFHFLTGRELKAMDPKITLCPVRLPKSPVPLPEN